MPINWIRERPSFVIPSQRVPLALLCMHVSVRWIRKMIWNAKWNGESGLCRRARLSSHAHGARNWLRPRISAAPSSCSCSTSPTIGVIVLEHRDRGTRFGFTYIEQLLAMQGRRREVIFPKETDDDLVNDAREHHYAYGGTDLWQAQQPKKSGTD